MIRINQIKCLPEQVTMADGGMDEELLAKLAAASMGIPRERIDRLFIRRRSIDARKKPDIFYIFSVDVSLAGMTDAQLLKKNRSKDCQKSPFVPYVFPGEGEEPLTERPFIIGMGPAGLFCAYELALHGYRPVLLERGKNVEERSRDVGLFWSGGVLNPDSNVQFGEGGAGAFSDGKLNTLIKDKDGRSAEVLRIFCEHGAKKEICYDHKPHLGTDALCGIVKSMREEIIRLGGEIHFETKLTGLCVEDGSVTGVLVRRGGEDAREERGGQENVREVRGGEDAREERGGQENVREVRGGEDAREERGGQENVREVRGGEDARAKSGMDGEYMPCGPVVLAIGHSARDTVRMLYDAGIPMEAKPFAVGLRVEHPQSFINESQYQRSDPGLLGAAAYKLTAQTKSGRGVYTFCMCPGGYVVNASSEPGMLAVNGMSYSGRDGQNANSAVIVTVNPEDFGDGSPLSGIAFQRSLERKAYELGGGKVPVERYGDFKAEVLREPARCAGNAKWNLTPCIKGQYTFARVSELLPEKLAEAFIEGMEAFGRKIPGYADNGVLLEGVESRTSSPVRILRGDTLVSDKLQNLYPCGEGAGYAGGIMSAAMDGLRVAEAIAAKYKNPAKEKA